MVMVGIPSLEWIGFELAHERQRIQHRLNKVRKTGSLVCDHKTMDATITRIVLSGPEYEQEEDSNADDADGVDCNDWGCYTWKGITNHYYDGGSILYVSSRLHDCRTRFPLSPEEEISVNLGKWNLSKLPVRIVQNKRLHMMTGWRRVIRRKNLSVILLILMLLQVSVVEIRGAWSWWRPRHRGRHYRHRGPFLWRKSLLLVLLMMLFEDLLQKIRIIIERKELIIMGRKHISYAALLWRWGLRAWWRLSREGSIHLKVIWPLGTCRLHVSNYFPAEPASGSHSIFVSISRSHHVAIRESLLNLTREVGHHIRKFWWHDRYSFRCRRVSIQIREVTLLLAIWQAVIQDRIKSLVMIGRRRMSEWRRMMMMDGLRMTLLVFLLERSTWFFRKRRHYRCSIGRSEFVVMFVTMIIVSVSVILSMMVVIPIVLSQPKRIRINRSTSNVIIIFINCLTKYWLFGSKVGTFIIA